MSIRHFFIAFIAGWIKLSIFYVDESENKQIQIVIFLIVRASFYEITSHTQQGLFHDAYRAHFNNCNIFWDISDGIINNWSLLIVSSRLCFYNEFIWLNVFFRCRKTDNDFDFERKLSKVRSYCPIEFKSSYAKNFCFVSGDQWYEIGENWTLWKPSSSPLHRLCTFLKIESSGRKTQQNEEDNKPQNNKTLFVSLASVYIFQKSRQVIR